MADYKYPYVPKEYYAAVMFACKIIRDTGHFNRAINTASKYYKVDKKELEKHVRARQGAGQKGKTRGEYHWYSVKYCVCDDRHLDHYEDEYSRRKVVKALSADNAKSQISNRYDRFEYWAEVGEVKEFDTKEEAEAYRGEP